MAVYAIIVAAGKSRRMGEGTNKLLLPLRGKTVIENTLDLFCQESRFAGIIVVTGDPFIKELAKDRGCLLASGGDRRQDSVVSGLKLLKDEDYVFIQDGARPFLNQEGLDACFEMVQEKKSFVMATQITDTLKCVEGDTVIKTLKRENHVLVQTPQGSFVGLLKKAYDFVERQKASVSDDASALEMIGEKIFVVFSGEDNRKITTPEDLRYLI
ncbi:MAG TPA: 2-C-methyl-D-erythritol 4-phosphate cytidylyltransferase [Clostridia bacterium]|nr:2-C-methyl-D-erythritol 4-phosphate cytidylyltransferase [Clostridia bacterium]